LARRSGLFLLLSVASAVVALSAAGCGDDDPSAPAAGAGGTAGSSGGGGGDPAARVAGDYTVSLTNGANTCPSGGDWVEGNQSAGIPFTIQQDGNRIWAEAAGPAAVLFILVTGEVAFEGEIHENEFSMTNYGTKVSQEGNCTYTVNATIAGTVDDNTIEGTVVYKPVITDNPDCAPFDCQAEQAYSGSRPP
jgi:hypothetical protein